MRGKPTVAERWWAKFEREPGTGCWLWTAAVDPVTGYGKFHVRPGVTMGVKALRDRDPRIKARVAASGCGTADLYATIPAPAAIRATA